MQWGPVPEWLSEVAQLALADLQQPRPIDVRLGYDPKGEGGGMLWLRVAGERGATGFWVPDEERGTELLVRLADSLQDQFFPETRAAWGEARPQCPGHPHPAQAVEIAGEPWWTCPADDRRVALIGRFGH